ncbi:MAG: hypothetical protein AB7S74_18040 [Hyphomicrobium sp.]
MMFAFCAKSGDQSRLAKHLVVLFILMCSSFLLGRPASAGPKLAEWATVKNERHGYAIAYPVDVFEQREAPRSDEGRVLYSKDGKARLLFGAFDNSQNNSLEQYRQFLLSEHYAGTKIDYAPVRKTWFVLSGQQGDQMFYQRVSFTCGGRLINSWAMLYPVAERKFYDRVVEAVARSFSPGAGRTGMCD